MDRMRSMESFFCPPSPLPLSTQSGFYMSISKSMVYMAEIQDTRIEMLNKFMFVEKCSKV